MKQSFVTMYGTSSDCGSEPFVLERTKVKKVEEDKDIVPILEAPPVAAIVMFSDMATDTTNTTPLDDDHSEGFFC